MSRSNPTAKNPATRFFQWRGGEEGGGRVTWYDKEEQTEKEMEIPFSFIVLDELNTITGFSEKDHSGFWSNEVRNMMTDDFVVRTSNGIVARGKYGKISDEIKSKGAKYAKSVYIAFKDETGELVIGNIKIAGAALTAWIEFQKKFDVMKIAVLLSGAKGAKKGSNKYFVPVFEGQKLSAESDAAASALDKEVQNYLGVYLNRKPDENDSEVVEDEDIEIEDLDEKVEVPEEANEQTTTGEAPAEPTQKPAPPKAVPANGGENEKINLADVPF